MALIESVNSKANVKQFTNNDLPFSSAQPVLSSFYAVSTNGQTSIANLGFSVSTLSTGLTDNFWLFVDGKKLTLGASNDYVFAAIGSDGSSSSITFNYPLAINLNIQAYKMGLTSQSDIGFSTDNRFTQLFEAEGAGFQGFINQTSFIMTPTTVAGTPAAGTFYTTIPNRASMPDLSQDLRVRMGIQRLEGQAIFEIPNEAGPNGEKIWGITNDPYSQVRLAGTWRWFTDSTSGSYLNSTLANDYIEVTFYGTGFNLLVGIFAVNQDIRVSVDGGAEGSNIYPSTTTNSTILGNRNYSENQILPCFSNLTLGVHTVKIRMQGSVSSQTVVGFEILNESSSIKVNPGVGYIQDKKLTTSAQAVQAYNSAFDSGTLAARGGHVVVYQKSDGTIGKAVTPTNSSQANLASADHTNEEVVRRHFFREFGAGRADDFSLLTSSSGTRAFALDDGTTNLVGLNVRNTTLASYEALNFGQSATTDVLTFTFVGTGLDVVWGADGTTTQVAVTVNGTSAGTFGPASAANILRIQRIVSGLPYGTHVVRFASSNVTNSVSINSFIVYQPKKPSIPSGAIELGDYNIMATYSANSTAASLNIGTGLLRKINVREFTYVGTWSINAPGSTLSSDEIGGIQAFSTTNGDFAQYVFFGTGFDFRFDNNATSSTWQISVDGSTNLTGATSYTTGTTTFTASTGTIVTGTSSGVGCGISFTGLTTGIHTFKITKISGTGTFYVQALDIVTPIHSAVSNLYSDFQNSLPVGSNGISDNRKVTPVKDILPATKAWAQAVGITSSPTTTSTGQIPMPDMSVTIKTSGGPVDISYSTGTFNGTSSDYVFTQIYVDGGPVGTNRRSSNVSNLANVISDSLTVQLAPGTHTIAVYWNVDAGTGTADSIRRNMSVKER